MKLDPEIIFQDLTTSSPVSLRALPREHGIYALHDHAGAIRYIGITRNDTLGLYGRIQNRHATGSESRSHKFSHAYNTGRMWRMKNDTRPDAKLAKSLRTAFVRRYCRATFVIIQPTFFDDLPKLELEVQAQAPAAMLSWGHNRSFVPLSEPTELVDVLLRQVYYSDDDQAAVRRQAELQVLTEGACRTKPFEL